MTSLLKKLMQEDRGKNEHSFDHDKPLASLAVYKQNLKSISPRTYEHNDYIIAVVGIKWLNRNLNEKEFAEYTAMRLKGCVT